MVFDSRIPYRKLGATDLRCHPLGFGGYRVTRGNREHEAALRAYLNCGGNLIDTSANYGDGLSEALVGEVLRDYPRDQVTVVSKGGYIQGQNLRLARQRNFPEVVYYGEGIWHCIHPEFLQAQIQLSLERMRLEKVDIYLLHNPEYFLTDKEHRGDLTAGDDPEFYRRIREAFRFLETESDRGRIGWYGISSNNFGLPCSTATMTSVSRCLEEARGLGRDHHFRIIQLPMNLYEPGGALEPNNGGHTVLELCQSEGIGVLVNRPLNAFAHGRLIRLADFIAPGRPRMPVESVTAMLNPLREHERRLARELQWPLLGGGTSGLADLIEKLVHQIDSPAHWESIANLYIIRPLRKWLEDARIRFAEDMRWGVWFEEFGRMIGPLLEDIVRYLSAKEQKTSDDVRERLYQAGYPTGNQSLSQMVVNVLVNLPGLDCVLIGMRRIAYVADIMEVPHLPAVDGLKILRRFNHP